MVEPHHLTPAWLDELAPAPGPPWHGMGTRALDPAAWLVVDDHRDEELARKRRLLAEAPEVVVATRPDAATAAAAAEAAALVAEASGATLAVAAAPRSPLEAAALLVQEDLCVLVRHADGWRLDAGVVCFPSMWRISDKLGLPITAVHGPVPAYADELAERVDRFLDRLRPDRPVWRRNWLLHPSPELHLPEPPAPEPVLVPGGMWLRSERQTLRRLPGSGAILFTIRTQQAPLAVVADRPDVAAGLAAAVRSWSDELVAYRCAGGWRASVLEWLEAVTA